MLRAHKIPLEVVGTVLEIADVARFALDHRHGGLHTQAAEEELAQLRSENLDLRSRLADYLQLLQDLNNTPDLHLPDACPPDLSDRLSAAVNSADFYHKIESQETSNTQGTILSELASVDIPVVIENEDEPSWWVWVPHVDIAAKLEEPSGIDMDSYVIVSEDSVVDAMADFIAVCILENPKSKNLSPAEVQRAVTNALNGLKEKWKWKSVWEAGKVIYTVSTWGITLAMLYRHRSFVKFAAKGVGASARLVMRAL